MSERASKSALVIRDLSGIEDLRQAIGVEREVWALDSADSTPLTLAVAMLEAGAMWIGAFDGTTMVGFAFAFLGIEHGVLNVHSHMLAVRALNLRVREMTWTFDPLQSKNAHLNFGKLGVLSDRYKIDFYGPETSSSLHRNGTDRLWVRWPLLSRRVQDRLRGQSKRADVLDTLSRLTPLVQFNGDGKPKRTDLASALQRQRIAIEIPADIDSVEQKDVELARAWREATRWAFTEALAAGFFVAEFCRTVRGQQGPGVYLLEKGTLEDHVPELARKPGIS